jgi:osmotically-inducible protein OsmY
MSSAELAAAVDYMLSTLGLAIPQVGVEKAASPPAQRPFVRMDDATLLANVAEALRARVAPRAKIEGARVGAITVEIRNSRVALRGMVDSAQVVRDAEEAALGVAGVAGVDNHLIPAELFEHD